MSAVAGIASNAQSLLPSRYGQLTSEDFVKLIFAELRQQDPFKPNDTSELLKQIDSIRGIQANMDLGARLSQVAQQGQLSGAGDLLGRWIKGLSTEFASVTGKVIGVQQSALGSMLELESGALVPVSQVQSIMANPPGGPGA